MEGPGKEEVASVKPIVRIKDREAALLNEIVGFNSYHSLKYDQHTFLMVPSC